MAVGYSRSLTKATTPSFRFREKDESLTDGQAGCCLLALAGPPARVFEEKEHF